MPFSPSNLLPDSAHILNEYLAKNWKDVKKWNEYIAF